MENKLQHLQCCCCGGEAIGRQWYNRDKGFGLCDNCADLLKTKESPEDMQSYYGIEGTHYKITLKGDDMENRTAIETIHESLVNGNRRQMIDQIKEYGLYNFWSDYRVYLQDLYPSDNSRYSYFSDATISYFRITNR